MEEQGRVQGKQWGDHCIKQCNIIVVEMLKMVRYKLQFEDSDVPA